MNKATPDTINQAARKIVKYLQRNGLFGTIYIENGVEYRVIDFTMTPYHAGALQIKSSAAFQQDYKTMGEPIYSQFREGMYDAAKTFGIEIAKAEPKEADQ